MAWIRNNTFLAVFLAVMIVGVAGLGFLLYSSYDNYQQVSQEYDKQVRELQRLQAKDPFPNQANLVKYQQVRTDYRQAVEELQNKLAAFEPPAEVPLSPTQFQDRLRQVVDGIIKTADQNGIAYPADFYLGFERYRSNLPDPGATLALTGQLNNIQEIVGILISRKVEKITSLKRTTLVQETGGSAVAATPAPGARGAAAKQPAEADLVSKSVVVLAFTGPPATFRDGLNDITGSKRLFVIRAVQVKNQMDKGPERGVPQTPPGGLAAAPTMSSDTPAGSEALPEKGPPPLRYVLGQEKVDVVVRIELTKVSPRR